MQQLEVGPWLSLEQSTPTTATLTRGVPFCSLQLQWLLRGLWSSPGSSVIIIALLTSSLNRLPVLTLSTYILESGTSTPKRGHGLHGTTSFQGHSHCPAGTPSVPQVHTELLLCFQSSPIECAEEDTTPPHSLLAAESLWNSLQILKTSRLRNLCKETFMRGVPRYFMK